MTRHGRIGGAALQARALGRAAARAIWLLGDRTGDAPDLAGDLVALGAHGPVALAALIERFALGPVERDAFLLAAAPELGPAAAAALAAHPLSLRGRATPALVAAALGPEAHWALTATGRLRDGALLTLAPGSGFAQRTLDLPQTVTAFLHGRPEMDPMLDGALHAIAAPPDATATQDPLATALMRARTAVPQPILHLATPDASRARARLARACAALGLQAHALEPAELPEGAETADLARVLNRDLVLSGACVLLPAAGRGARLAERVYAPAVTWGAEAPSALRPVASLAVRPEDDPPPPAALAGLPRALGLSPGDLADAAASHAMGFAPSPRAVAQRRAAAGLEGLAQRIRPQATWEDLVLPPAQMGQLRGLARFLAHRDQVLGDWGFRAKSERGLALTALFSGPSGTGKTMAAEVLARTLGEGETPLELYRIDLSAVVSKYIGETEKNIGRIFDAAERSGAILIFDEGEALFARRSAEVRDSLDRHANSETAYLLQRLEAYSGIAIVTTNLKGTVDEAFLRRFRAVVDFPFPSAELRAAIWRVVFPPETPTEGLDHARLGRLSLSGGFIRSIALTAAFLAAEAGTPVTMALIAQAARSELGKLGKPLSETELAGLA